MRNKGFFKSATKFLPVLHGQYRQMCSLAAVGQLGGPQMCELDEHIATCDSCRTYLESVAQASVQVLPVLAEDRIPAADITPPIGMRSRFLARLAEERKPENKTANHVPFGFIPGMQVTGSRARSRNGRDYREEERIEDPDEELVFQRLDPREMGNRELGVNVRHERQKRALAGRYIWVPAAIAAALVLAVGGFYLGRKVPSASATPTPLNVATPTAIVEGAKTSKDSDRVSRLEREKAALESQLGALRGQLSASDVQEKELSARLVEVNEKLASLQRVQQSKSQGTGDPSASLRTSNEQEMQVATLQKEVARLRSEFDDAILKITAQQHENDDLRSKLEITEANLRQEVGLKDAKSQMGELVAARNLHIVDVYDADPSGKRQRAFGRVFYTEGQSLVFYAYDLEDHRQLKGNVVFHVWGGKAGVKEVTHSLGILHKDSEGDARWKMTFDDPNVLAQINTVFVTTESAGKSPDSPHGKKVLYAYFGSAPNHP
jgi:hypothetical protein